MWLYCNEVTAAAFGQSWCLCRFQAARSSSNGTFTRPSTSAGYGWARRLRLNHSIFALPFTILGFRQALQSVAQVAPTTLDGGSSQLRNPDRPKAASRSGTLSKLRWCRLAVLFTTSIIADMFCRSPLLSSGACQTFGRASGQ